MESSTIFSIHSPKVAVFIELKTDSYVLGIAGVCVGDGWAI